MSFLLLDYTGSAMKFPQTFVSIVKENTCAKFHRKTITTALELELLEVFI